MFHDGLNFADKPLLMYGLVHLNVANIAKIKPKRIVPPLQYFYAPIPCGGIFNPLIIDIQMTACCFEYRSTGMHQVHVVPDMCIMYPGGALFMYPENTNFDPCFCLRVKCIGEHY